MYFTVHTDDDDDTDSLIFYNIRDDACTHLNFFCFFFHVCRVAKFFFWMGVSFCKKSSKS